MYATRTVHKWETASSAALIRTQRHRKITAIVGTHCFIGEQKSNAASAKNPRAEPINVARVPQSLHWPLRVLLQWLNVRQKLHSTCEFNKTWQPLFRAAVLEEARLSNKSLDALRRSIYHLYHGAEVYMDFRTHSPSGASRPRVSCV